MAGKYNIHIDTGATYVLDLTWKDDEGNLIDLTSYEAHFQIRKVPSNPSTVIAITEQPGEQGQVTLGGEDGTISIRVEAEATEGIEPGKYFYGLELAAGGGGDQVLLLEGHANLSPSVVR